MLEFFRNIFKKLKSTINQDRYIQKYSGVISLLRRVTPLELPDIEKMHTILRECVSNQELLDRRMKILKEALRNKFLMRRRHSLPVGNRFSQKSGRKIDNNRDVSYYVGGKVVHGEVQSEEENLYFSKEHVESLNRMPLRPKKCDFDCVVNECKSCMEKRLRAEISRNLESENERLSEERVKKRKKSCDVISDLNEQFGIPRIFGISVADECFDVEELDSREREDFINWKESQEASAKAVRGSLDLKGGYAELDKKHAMPPLETVHTDVANGPGTRESTEAGSSVTHQICQSRLDENSTLLQNVSGAAEPSLGISSEFKFSNPFAAESSYKAPPSGTGYAVSRNNVGSSGIDKSPQLPTVLNSVRNPFTSEVGNGALAPPASTEPFKNPFAVADINKGSLKAPPAESSNQKPLSFGDIANPFYSITSPSCSDAAMSPKDSKATSCVSASTEQPPAFSAIASPFSSSLLTNPFSGTSSTAIGSAGQSGVTPLDKAPHQSTALSFSNQNPPGQSLQNVSAISNPFAGAGRGSLLQFPKFTDPLMPKPSVAPNPFSSSFQSSNTLKPPSGSSQLTNPFIQGNPFSSENIFQNNSNQDDPGFFSSNDSGAEDGFRRKKAYRKR